MFRVFSFVLALASIYAAPAPRNFTVYLGESGPDAARAITVDPEGNTFLAGNFGVHAFAAKVNADGSRTLWRAALPGPAATALALHPDGNLRVATTDALLVLDPATGALLRSDPAPGITAFVLSPTGDLYYAVGAQLRLPAGETVTLPTAIRALAAAPSGEIHVLLTNAVARLSATGELLETTPLDWQPNALTVDSHGALYLTGANARIQKLGAFIIELPGLFQQEGRSVAVDADGFLYAAGWTNSSDFAHTRTWHGDRDGYFVKLSPTGEILDIQLLGSAVRDEFAALALAPNGNVHLAGLTESAGLGATDVLLIQLAANRALTSTTTTLTVNPASTAALSQPVTLTAAVSPAATGSVSFYDGVTILGTATLTAGVATLTTPFLPSGAHTLRVAYLGDATYSASASAPTALTVTAVPSLRFNFLSEINLPTPFTQTFAMTNGDFNGDGARDLAVTSPASNTVIIYLNNGAGGFTLSPSSAPATGAEPRAILSADFNGDGKADLAVANRAANTVTILLGNGAGAFSPAPGSPASTGSIPLALATADFNGDGRPDLAVVNSGSNTVSILLGNGDGSFTAFGAPATGSTPVSIAAGDWNGDGKADLVIANSGSNNASLLLGDGAGNFTAAAATATGNQPLSIVAGDFNSDGFADFATANYASGSITIALGNGAGAFTISAVVVDAQPVSVTTGDFNGDGKADLAAASGSLATIRILYGNGAGAFPTSASLPISNPVFALSTGDFDRDGRTDVALIGQFLFQVFTGVGPSVLNLTTSPAATSPYGQLLTLNATVPTPGAAGTVSFYDGSLFLGKATLASGAASVTTRLRDAGPRILKAVFASTVPNIDSATTPLAHTLSTVASASFVPSGAGTLPTGAQPRRAATGDFNGDGKFDFAVTNFQDNTVSVYLGNGNGAFTQSPGSPFAVPPAVNQNAPVAAQPIELIAVDINFDGRSELVVGASTANRIHLFWFSPTGAQLPGSPTPYGTGLGFNFGAGFPSNFALGGNLLFVGTSNSFLNYFSYSTTSNGLVNDTSAFSQFSPSQFVASADFNGDGLADVALASNTGSLKVYLQTSSGFSANNGTSTSLTLSGTISAVLTADFNNDGKSDLAVFNSGNPVTGEAVSVYLGNGDGTFTTAASTPTAGPAATPAIGDMNGDGKVDLVFANTAANTVSVLLGNGAGAFTAATYSPISVPGGPVGLALGDFNSDARQDILVATANNAATTILYGANITGPAQPPTLVNSSIPTVVGSPQTFTVTGRDPNGVADIGRIYFLINANSDIPTNSCHGYYDRATNGFYLYNNDYSLLLGPTGSLSNSQCTLNTGGSSVVSAAGTDLTVQFNFSLNGAYANAARNVYFWVQDNEAYGTGWVQTATWAQPLPNQPPTVVSATPTTAAGVAQTFRITTRDANGSSDISRIYFVLNGTATVPVNSCHGFYDRTSNALFLYNDNLTVLAGPLTAGANNSIANSQCGINGLTSTVVSGAGTDFVLDLTLTRATAFANLSQNVYFLVTEFAGNNSGWVQTGTWPALAPSLPPSIAHTQPVQLTGSPKTIDVTITDPNGFDDISRIYFVIGASTNITTATCHGFFDRNRNRLYLYDDPLTTLMGPVFPGAAGTLQNSKCTFDGPTTAVLSATGNTVNFRLGVSLNGSFATSTQNVYVLAQDNSLKDSGWVTLAVWSPTPTQPLPPTVASVTPPPTITNPFSVVDTTISDPNGAQDISRIYFYLGSSTTITQNSCHGFVVAATGAIFLYNDALTALSTTTGNPSAVVQNSQCAIYGVFSKLQTVGGSLQLSLAYTLKGSYLSGTRNLYYIAVDQGQLNSTWVQTAVWTPVAPANGPLLSVATVQPSSNSARAFDLTITDAGGFGNIDRVYFLIDFSPTVRTNSCHGFYQLADNSFYLYNDSLTTLGGPAQLQTSATISNSQCAALGLASGILSYGGNSINLRLGFDRLGTFLGTTQKLYVWYVDKQGRGTGWINAATWTAAP